MVINEETLKNFRIMLLTEEKSLATVQKYSHDVKEFGEFCRGKEVTIELVLAYKTRLRETMSAKTTNSRIAAINSYFKHMGEPQFCVKPLREQRSMYIEEDRMLTEEEYQQMVRAAYENGYERTALLLEAICSTGIRVGELPFLTVESARAGRANIDNKGKVRTILMPSRLQEDLLAYAEREKITHGSIFITFRGKPIARENIWNDMKRIAKLAGVNPRKVYPHSLRHLFARTYLEMDNDLAHLADILGHSNINTTRIYTATFESEQKNVLDKMNLAFANN